MARPTAEQLYTYAARFAERAERAGRGTQWPTLAAAAHRFGCSIGDIEDAAEGYGGDGYMGIAVGVGIAGSGYAEHKHRGECQIEAYGDSARERPGGA
jgi:hypothetical protein